jgi:hypothetical protein
VKSIQKFLLEPPEKGWHYRRILVEMLLLLVPYVFFLSHWDFTETLPDTLYSATDAQQYKAYGEYLTGAGGYASDTRPYFFPLFIRFSAMAGGDFGVWFMQALLHVCGGLLLFAAVRQTSKTLWGWLMVWFFYALHPSLAVHTLYALTETLTVFLMALFVYFLTRRPHVDSLRRVKAVAVLAVAVVVKPVYLYVFVFALCWLCWRERKFLFKSRNSLLILVFSLAVVLVQPLLMKVQQGEFFVSRIGEITLRDYYYRLLYARTEGINFGLSDGPLAVDALRIDNAVRGTTSAEIVKYAMKHPLLAVQTGAEVVYGNVDSSSQLYKRVRDPVSTEWWGYIMRKISLYAHFLAVACLLYLFLRRARGRLFPGFKAISVLLVYILLVSGISFWQGDRLVIFALPLWVVLYAAVYSAVCTDLYNRLVHKHKIS